MLITPRFYNNFDRSASDNVYKAMRSKDMSECVVSALNELRKNNNLLMPLKTKEKSTFESAKHIVRALTYSENGDHESAFWEHNMALLRAPPNSDQMRIAYYFRAELSFKLKQYTACLKDVEIAIAMDKFPFEDDHSKKMRKLRMEVSMLAHAEKHQHTQMQSSFTDKFFEIGECNPNIPCVSSNIEVIVESQRPKVIAAKDIPVGTVVVSEPAFATYFCLPNRLSICYYCNKMALSLIPCDGCCYTMFCDEQCKAQSMQEGHDVECKIIGVLLIEDLCLLAFKAVLKMRQMCQSWNELVLASHELGVDRMRKSSVADIFGSDKFSLLNSSKDSHFIYGAMFKNCMYLANIIYYLDIKTSFLPDSPEDKNAAISAISRIMMHLLLCGTPVGIPQAVNVVIQNCIKISNKICVAGYFPFISNLSYSCQPNTYIMGTRRKAVLVTTKLIKQGTEITTTHFINNLKVDEAELPDLKRRMFINAGILCICNNCVGNKVNVKKGELTVTQKRILQTFLLETALKELRQEIKCMYKQTCETMHLLKEVSYSKQYEMVSNMFLRCVLHCIYSKYPNFCISDDLRSILCVSQYLFDD